MERTLEELGHVTNTVLKTTKDFVLKSPVVCGVISKVHTAILGGKVVEGDVDIIYKLLTSAALVDPYALPLCLRLKPSPPYSEVGVRFYETLTEDDGGGLNSPYCHAKVLHGKVISFKCPGLFESNSTLYTLD